MADRNERQSEGRTMTISRRSGIERSHRWFQGKMIDDAVKNDQRFCLVRYHAGLCEENRGQCELNHLADFQVMKHREYHQP
jgi:hypothetical protein